MADLPELREAGEEMSGRKRANNGIEPGKVIKGIGNVALTEKEWAAVRKACDKYDATAGWVAQQSLRSWLRWKGIR